jgi:rhamnosyltransferase
MHSHNNSLEVLFKKYFDAGTAHMKIFKNKNNVYLPLIPLFAVAVILLDLQFMMGQAYKSTDIVKWIPEAFVRHLVEAIGFWLGLHFDLLPLSLKRKFTASGRY